MAKTGDVIANPSTGEEFTIRRSAAETNGEVLEGEVHVAAHAGGPGDHVHAMQEERYTVVSGTLNVSVAGRERAVGEGEQVVVPARTRHSFWNAGEGEAVFHLEVRPTLRLETFLETWFGLAHDGKTNRNGTPNLLQAAVIMHEYSDELRLAFPPPIVQTVLFGALAAIGKLFGYKARYAKYSGDEPVRNPD